MIIGPPSRLTCPHCGGYKYIESILSGNTFRATYWSDGKRDFPMMPAPSFVQKCNHCGGFFFLEDAKSLGMSEENRKSARKTNLLSKLNTVMESAAMTRSQIEEEASRNGFGRLSEEEAREAYAALFSDELPRGKKAKLLMVRLHAFNDEYLRERNTLMPDLQDMQADFVRNLQELFPEDPIFVAELHRELGEFDKAIELLNKVLNGKTKEENYVVAQKILDHAMNHDRTVFVVARH